MPAATSPSPPPFQGAVEASNGILITSQVEQTFERIRFDIHELIRIPAANEPWKSCYVPTDQIEPEASDWGLIKSAPGVCVIGKTSDGNFYEVAVCKSYFPWLVSHKFQFELGHHYDRTKPADADVRVYGILPARRRAQAYFFENIVREISCGRGRTFERYCRHIVPCRLQIPFERAILNHHVLTSDPQVRDKLCQWLVAWTQWVPLCMFQSSKSFLDGISTAVLSAKPDLISRIPPQKYHALWYNFWIFISGVVLYASILRYLESPLASIILFFSTCGEFFTLFKHVHVRHSSQQPHQRLFLLACASLSFLKFILTCFVFFVDRTELIGIGNLLAFSALIICAL